MPERKSAFVFSIAEYSGAVADLGVMLPLALVLITLNGLDAAAVFVGVGVSYLLCAAVYWLLVPVQPLKSVSATAIALGLAPVVIAAGAMWNGLAILGMGALGLDRRAKRVFPKALNGVRAMRMDDLAGLPGYLAADTVIPVVVQDFAALLAGLRPDALIDARMRKHQQPERQMGLAAMTIGSGPNFVAGETVDLAVKTGWGEALGTVVTQGAANLLQGEPSAIGGHARDRYVYAPAEGVFVIEHEIGDDVAEGKPVAAIGTTTLHAPISGRLRGLTRSGCGWRSERR